MVNVMRMVRLDRITLHGFKSFANKVTIPFPEGFNVIAGPNGSGKSNVVDALTFILGTTSARSIRAQKLQNLLFNGARDKKPAEYCEVSIYLDNTDKKIPNEEQEVKITRKISRSGITIYKLNGKTVTRAKVLDLLVNANLSQEGYNIIAQGDVTHIIEMNNQERRAIIDEISGIAEFDEKKEKAQRELEKVENRVRENMIVVAEKQRLVQRLRQEKENAEAYQKLSGELRLSKASLLRKRLSEAEQKDAELERQIREDTKQFDVVEKNFIDAEKASEEKEKLIASRSNELIKKSRNYEIIKNIDRIQTEILRKRDKLDINDREIGRLENISRKRNPVIDEVLRLGKAGVHGTLASLLTIPKKYSTAIEVALGKHASDIVVETDEIATQCIKHLKERRIGRARFLPMDRLRTRDRKKCDHKIIGYAIDLIKFDGRYRKATEYVLGSTIVVDDIDTARRIRDFRIVTLDGDLIESTGAMIGGFYRKRDEGRFSGEIAKLKDESEQLSSEIEVLEAQLEQLKGMEQQEGEEVQRLQEEKTHIETDLEAVRKQRRQLFEERLVMQNKVSKLRIEKAKLDASLDSLKMEADEYRDVAETLDLQQDVLQENIRRCLTEINRLGPVNMRAIEEYGVISVEFDEIKKKLDKLIEEKEAILRIVQEVEKKRHDKFMETFSNIASNFLTIYHDLTNGSGMLRLELENNIESGLVIEASPEGKKVLNLDAMSGGEKTLTSLAFLFSILQHYSSPFYVLDEIDAALDKANTKKIIDLVKKYSKHTQFIVISHNDFTIQEADKVFGVSMEEGVSKVFGIEMPKG